MKPAEAARSTAPHRRILLIVVALIVYGSLYPWQFHARDYGVSPLWILLHSWPVAVDRFMAWDVAINIALYMPLGIFGLLAIPERAPRLVRICLPLALALVLSASIEMIQLFDDSRMCSLSDVASNVAGAAVGIAAGTLYRSALQRLVAGHGAATLLRPSGALLLLSCWLGYQFFPLFPTWGRTSLYRRIAALEHAASISPVETLLIFAEWLAVACLLDSLLKTRTRILLPLLMLLPTARLIIASRTLSWPDILGAAAAYAFWLCVPRTYMRRTAPILITGALLVGELAPFRFGAAQHFTWVPFRGLFHSAWESGIVILFRKSFWYGSLLWLWRASGVNLTLATAAAAISLFLLERVQVYVPGRTPEITDTVLTVLMGILLWLLRDE